MSLATLDPFVFTPSVRSGRIDAPDFPVELQAVNAPFERTLRLLAAERRRPPWALFGALVVIAGWVTWAVMAQVGVHLTSVAGRIEAREPVNVLRCLLYTSDAADE